MPDLCTNVGTPHAFCRMAIDILFDSHSTKKGSVILQGVEALMKNVICAYKASMTILLSMCRVVLQEFCAATIQLTCELRNTVLLQAGEVTHTVLA